MSIIAQKINDTFAVIETHCAAIYKGGSRVDPVIDNPHDYDYICFAKSFHKQLLQLQLQKLGLKTSGSKKRKIKEKSLDPLELDLDFSQIRIFPYTNIDWFSYLDVLMVKVIGSDVCPKTDIIDKYRRPFIEDLQKKAKLISAGIITNQKRWYHILRGIYILKNRSYEVSEEQRKEINILHDLTPGWEEVRDKTIQLLNNLED